MTKLCVATLLTALFALGGCVPVAVGAAGMFVTTTLVEERGITGTISDAALRSGVNATWAKNQPKLLSRLSVTVREGRVLLTGRVETEAMKKEAIRLTWTVSGVVEAIDRIAVGEAPPKTSGYVGDSWITSKISTSMLTDSQIQSVNYTVKTCEGIVYIMGIARHQKELDDVIAIARKSKGVQKVVSYVRVRDTDSLTKQTERTDVDQDSTNTSRKPSHTDASLDSGLEPVELGPAPSVVEARS
ncbi:MAG: BON domain-containing protein [Alphaproteobacteria bacterium]|nr:MAG: BON domain-containing protein [Alphaproteobacteria bacterium]